MASSCQEISTIFIATNTAVTKEQWLETRVTAKVFNTMDNLHNSNNNNNYNYKYCCFLKNAKIKDKKTWIEENGKWKNFCFMVFLLLPILLLWLLLMLLLYCYVARAVTSFLRLWKVILYFVMSMSPLFLHLYLFSMVWFVMVIMTRNNFSSLFSNFVLFR